MIKYALRCAKGHEFEGWFKSSDSFDSQARRGVVTCPSCGAKKVEKAVMAPRIGGSRTDVPAAPVDAAAAVPTVEPQAMMARMAEAQSPKEFLRAMRRFVEATCEPVGDKFADAALKIHRGEAPERNIFGSSTPEERALLEKEGVEVDRLPWVPLDDA
ncbi:MAG: DUF1178 family protein [Alphaproteobacteria bacterium]|nr:DUF1178 family protein [Alphaproteobacteria bacterium]